MSGKRFCPLFFALAALSGCGPSPATVSGAITVDGQPVELGYITCSSADGIGQPATADIINGRYEIKSVVGKKFVMISALKVLEKRKESDAPNAPWVDITEERLPERYNTKTELTLTLLPGPNVKDWILESKDKKP